MTNLAGTGKGLKKVSDYGSTGKITGKKKF
jgi:hypothetical protein